MKYRMILAGIIITVVAVVMIITMNAVGKANTFAVTSDKLEIGGAFGTTVSLARITNLDIKATMPAVGMKTNGSGMGAAYKGEFNLQDGTKARLYVDASKPPFITFKQEDVSFFLNLDTPEKTQELYNQLKEAIAK